MLWKKFQVALDSSSKKIVLERTTLFGKVEVRKYIEQDLPLPNGHPVGTVYCLTRLRRFWKFRFSSPLHSSYFLLTHQKRWVQLCRSIH